MSRARVTDACIGYLQVLETALRTGTNQETALGLDIQGYCACWAGCKCTSTYQSITSVDILSPDSVLLPAHHNLQSRGIICQVYNAGELLEYCQGFLLQNMVALLTYDDSVKRLLFGKKLHSHDVLAGLLLTLQARIKARNPRTAKPK
uniref:Uncharacterized protein n=1 Tax=Timema tahoe TaxID=61484 RepID=A0A7R9FIC7_9NEOP|nr:unnamed protein product [Timema tahoe]